MTKRKIPPVDTRSYAQEDYVYVRQDGKDLTVVVGQDEGRTIFLDQKETMAFLLLLLQKGQDLWGESFTQSVMAHAEKI